MRCKLTFHSKKQGLTLSETLTVVSSFVYGYGCIPTLTRTFFRTVVVISVTVAK